MFALRAWSELEKKNLASDADVNVRTHCGAVESSSRIPELIRILEQRYRKLVIDG